MGWGAEGGDRLGQWQGLLTGLGARTEVVQALPQLSVAPGKLCFFHFSSF